jgi:hypothetical protein
VRNLILFILPGLPAFCQDLSYSPAMTIERTVPADYYDTEYIFIGNAGNETVSLEFELVEYAVPGECSESVCTNVLCYIDIPDEGSLGVLDPGQEAYVSLNFSANGFVGDAVIRYAVRNPADPGNADTIAFVYHAAAAVSPEPLPWAALNVTGQIITVFVHDQSAETFLYLYDGQGNLVANQQLDEIGSLSLATFAAGTYIVRVENERGQRIAQKVVHL